jgi:deoxyribodipyrimidine photo-lyase
MKAIYWLRTDLRTFDNEALTRCLNENRETLFVFAETQTFRRAGKIRKAFIQDCCDSFQSEMKGRGITVLKTSLSFTDFLSSHDEAASCDTLYFTKEFAWEERQEEIQVQRFCEENQIAMHSFDQGTLVQEKDLPFKLSEMPFGFNEFRKKIESELLIRPPTPGPFSGKENKGLARLNHYLWKTHAVQTYKNTRNGMIRFDDSSKLSPWLNVGMISARTVYSELK